MVNVIVEENKPKHNELPKGITLLVAGVPKVGKTTEFSKWSDKGHKGVLLIDTDLGSDFVECTRVTVTSLNVPTRPKLDPNGKQIIVNGKPKVEVIPPTERGFVYRTGEKAGQPMPVYSMVEVMRWIAQQLEKGQFPYDTVVIDTINRVNEWIEEIVLKEMNISAMGEAAWGTDWAKARKKNLDIMKRLQLLLRKHGRNLVLICHAKPTTVTENIVQGGLELPRGLAVAVQARADVIGHVYIPKGKDKAVISFVAYDERNVGSRLKALAGKEIELSYKTFKEEIEKYVEEQA